MTTSPTDTQRDPARQGSGDDHARGGPDEVGATFVFDVDDVTYQHDRPRITGAEIMAIAGVTSNEGLIQVLPDGTREAVGPEDMIHLVPGVQFKRRPRFKRG
jgi:hypothetical protein